MRFCHFLPTLLSTSFTTAFVADAAAVSSDWLLTAVPTAPSVSDGTLGGVATISLENGLISRTFAIVPGVPTPPPPPPPPGIPCPPPPQCTTCGNRTHCCPNPGNKSHHGPNAGEVYPYFGMPCDQQSDCAECTCFLHPTCPTHYESYIYAVFIGKSGCPHVSASCIHPCTSRARLHTAGAVVAPDVHAGGWASSN